MTPRILHLANGSTIIGLLNTNPTISSNWPTFEPYELMVTPNPDSLKSQVTLVPYGSLYGAILAIAPPVLEIPNDQVFAIVADIPNDLLAAYSMARIRTAEERARIDTMLREAKTDISKGGTL